MSNSIELVRVFIGSPGGLDEERRAAREVEKEVNLANSEHWGCQLQLIGWEDTIPGFQRPQAKINEDLDKCDYFIGMLWNRWGTKPSISEDGYTSGFEEEYFRARKNIEIGKMKDLVIYFKSVEVPDGLEPGPDIKKVLDFRKQCIDQKVMFFRDFRNIEEFQKLVRSKLMEIGWKETKVLKGVDQGTIQPEQSPQVKSKQVDETTGQHRLIDEQGTKFLAELSSRSRDWDQTKSHEVARFRLLAVALRRSGNDETYLGNHDANLIFKNYRNSTLSAQELRALVDCGIVGFEYHNVPLWNWLALSKSDGDYFHRVNLLAVVGTAREKINAIRVMHAALQPLPALDEYFDKERTLITWLSRDDEEQLFDTAISYISRQAVEIDIPLIEKVSETLSVTRKTKVEAAIVGILCRFNPNSALQRITEKQIDKLEDWIADKLFLKPKSLNTDKLILCLIAKPDNVRLRATKILFDRNEIDLLSAESLLTDSNHEIRLLAAESLKKLGHELNDDIVKKVLTISKQNPLTRYSLFKLSETDASYYERYVANRAAELTLPELKQKVANASVFNTKELGAYYSTFKFEAQSEIRKNLEDQFENHMKAGIKKIEEDSKNNPELIASARDLDSFLRKNLCALALGNLCSIARATDLPLVRSTVDKMEIAGSSSVLKFFARYGEWSDLGRVIRLGDIRPDRTNLWANFSSQMPKEKASAIMAIGKNRIADLLSFEMDNSIKRSLLTQLPSKAIAELSNETLIAQLNRDDDECRALLAIRCVLSLSKQRVATLLEQYVDREGSRFYNSVHWLDLGASMPFKLARKIAEHQLSVR